MCMLIDWRTAKPKMFSKPATVWQFQEPFQQHVKYANTYECLLEILVVVLFLGSNSGGTKAEEGSSAAGDWVLQGTKVWLHTCAIDFVDSLQYILLILSMNPK